MIYNEPAVSIPDQITKLKARGLAIGDDAFAIHCLYNISYYRLSKAMKSTSYTIKYTKKVRIQVYLCGLLGKRKIKKPLFFKGLRSFREVKKLLLCGDGGSRTRVQNIAQ